MAITKGYRGGSLSSLRGVTCQAPPPRVVWCCLSEGWEGWGRDRLFHS